MGMREDLAERWGTELMFMDPDDFDAAIVGVVERFHDIFVLYDRDKVLEIFTKDGGDPEEILEHYEFNVIGGWYGSATPGFVSPIAIDTG